MDTPDRRSISVPGYVSGDGVRVEPEGGILTVAVTPGEILIAGDAGGLRDLARWCLALSDPEAPSGAHAHFDPGVDLEDDSLSLVIERRG